MKQWRIKTKKDWVIAAIFAALVIYAVSTGFTQSFNERLLPFMPDKLSYVNQPSGYGNAIVTAGAMTVLVIIVMVMKKIRRRYCLLAAFGGILLMLGLFAAYMVHCNLIVGTAVTLLPESANLSDGSGRQCRLTASDEELIKLAHMANALKPLPEEEQKQLRQKYASSDFEKQIHIWISYPKKYGQSYDFILRIENEHIFYYRGNTSDTLVFYENNGFINEVNQLLSNSNL